LGGGGEEVKHMILRAFIINIDISYRLVIWNQLLEKRFPYVESNRKKVATV